MWNEMYSISHNFFFCLFVFTLPIVANGINCCGFLLLALVVRITDRICDLFKRECLDVLFIFPQVHWPMYLINVFVFLSSKYTVPQRNVMNILTG